MMRKAPIPANEELRLASLHELDLLDKDHHSMFEGAAELAAQVFGTRTALISLVDAERQWFACRHNFEAQQTARDISFCGHAINGSGVMVVPDARLDSRFRDNPLVQSDEPVVFYAGAPLLTPDALALGTLCVLDSEPKYPSERQVNALEQLARLVSDQMELRRAMLRREREAQRSVRFNKHQSRHLYNIAQDLRTALTGMVDVTERLDANADRDSLERAVSAIKYGAVSLLQITELLSADALSNLGKGHLTLTAVNPLSVGASALSVYAAESERRGVETSIGCDPGASVQLFTDQEQLRSLIFHSLGFMLSKMDAGSLDLHLARGACAERVVFRISAIDPTLPAQTLEGLQFLEGDEADDDSPLARTLSTVRDLCLNLGGRVNVTADEGRWQLALELPVISKVKASNT